MKNRRTVLWIVLALVVVLGGAGALYSLLGREVTPQQLVGEEPQGEANGEASASQRTPPPDFTVYDGEGREVRLSDFAGRPVVLNFWASWCGPCKMEMPDFQEGYQDLGDQVQFLMVNLTDGSQETVDSAAEFIAQQGYTFPVFYDTRSDAAATYGAYSIPRTYFIDAEGYVAAWAAQAISGETLQQGIDLILP